MSKCRCSTSYDVAKYTWPIPAGVRKYGKEWFRCDRVFQGNSLNVGWMRKLGKTFVMRTFRLHRSKKYGLEIAEIKRQVANEKPVLCNCDFKGYLAGWGIINGAEWNPADAYDGWSGKKGGPWSGECINRDEMISKYFPYCAFYETRGLNITFWDYIQIYLREPKVELLAKLGYAPLIPSYRLLDRKGKSLAAILKVNDKWVEYLKGRDVWHLLACRKKGCKTVEDVEAVADCMAHPEAKKFFRYAQGDEMRMAKYLHSSQIIGRGSYELFIYSDYLAFAQQLGLPLNEHKYLYPEKLRQKHDELLAQIKEAKSKARSADMLKWSEVWSKYCFSFGGMFIRPAKDDDDLINESKQMCNCVRTYADRYASGQTAIFFIRYETKPDASVATLELRNKRIIQCLGHGNKPVTQDVNVFVDAWKRAYQFT